MKALAISFLIFSRMKLLFSLLLQASLWPSVIFKHTVKQTLRKTVLNLDNLVL